jgi:uncharacterized protein YjbJ (UPF0337 family)
MLISRLNAGIDRSNEMNQDIIKGKWAQLGGKLRQTWGKLTDDDINQLEGHREYLVGRLQERYGIAKDKADAQVDAFERTLN